MSQSGSLGERSAQPTLSLRRRAGSPERGVGDGVGDGVRVGVGGAVGVMFG